MNYWRLFTTGSGDCKMLHSSDTSKGLTCVFMVSDYALINIDGFDVKIWGDPESFCWVLYSRLAEKWEFDASSSYLNAG